MKTKLIISFLVWVFIVGLYLNKKREEIQQPPVSSNVVTDYKLSKEQQLERLDYLLSGKADKYECETDFRKIGTGSVMIDRSKYGNGAGVVYSKAGRDGPGYVVSGIKMNSWVRSRNRWLNDTSHNYSIRPRIRIERGLIYPRIEGLNGENWHTKICRLEVVNTEGKIIRDVEYEGKDFFEKDSIDECKLYYSGNYMVRRSFLAIIDSVIKVNGKELNPKAVFDTESTKLDFRIYWYGYTDMWLDYIKIENEVIEGLLNGEYDMWLKAMNNIKPADINTPDIPGFQKTCLNYLLNRLYILNAHSN